jgi:glycosyltransferase involved in cell wall biosynthesis
MPELVNSGEDGFLVPPRDPTALREAINCFVRNPEHAAEMGRCGREKMVRLFNRDLYYERLLDIYRKAQNRAH